MLVIIIDRFESMPATTRRGDKSVRDESSITLCREGRRNRVRAWAASSYRGRHRRDSRRRSGRRRGWKWRNRSDNGTWKYKSIPSFQIPAVKKLSIGIIRPLDPASGCSSIPKPSYAYSALVMRVSIAKTLEHYQLNVSFICCFGSLIQGHFLRRPTVNI